MSKRSNPRGNLPPNKRRRTENEAIELLLSHRNELIQSLQALTNPIKREALQTLRDLSKTLLPSFKFLAEVEKEDCQVRSDFTDGQVKEKTSNVVQKSSNSPRHALPPLGPLIPSFTIVTPWTAADIATSLPPLPQILNPVLEKAAFTHIGVVKHKDEMSYDRLEWLGDAYLEVISTSLIFQTFGGMPTGKCSQLRELLIRNANIGEYSKKYGFFERARLPVEFDPKKPSQWKAKPQEVKKVQGDLFEAYVAAIILSDPENGVSRTAEWLKALWSVTIKDQIRAASKDSQMQIVKELSSAHSPAVASANIPVEEVNIPPKVQLQQIVGARGINIRYEDLPSANTKDKYNKKLPLFTVGVYLDGWGERNKLLGTGSDLNKKEAGQKAAQMALNNKKLMKMYEAKKNAFQAALGESESKPEMI